MCYYIYDSRALPAAELIRSSIIILVITHMIQVIYKILLLSILLGIGYRIPIGFKPGTSELMLAL